MLRIISMLMIVSIHYWLFCFPIDDLQPLSFEWCFGTVLKGLSLCSVNIYILISSYFLCTSKFKAERLWSLWKQVFFYSISIYLILLLAGLKPFSLSEIRVCLPVSMREYWFVTEYVALMILSPLLNKTIHLFTKEDFKKLVIILVSLTVVYQSVFFIGGGITLGRGMDIVWFVVLYYIGSYIRLYMNLEKIKLVVLRYKLLLLLLILLPSIWGLFAGAVTSNLIGKRLFVEDLWVYNSILVVPASVVLFMVALVSKPFNRMNGIVTFFAKASFAVYLITDNRNFRYVLWEFVRDHTSVNTPNIIWQYLATIFGLYVLCALIDGLRSCVSKNIAPPSFLVERFKNLDNWINI